MSIRLPLWCLALWSFLRVSGADFTISPAQVRNDYAGLVTFQMDGLVTGETVLIEQVYDFDGNGVVNGPDRAIRSDQIVDGELRLLGGATNINVLRDEDGATNGSIRATLRFAASPELARGVGHYVFRFSSPFNRFPSQNMPFTVVSAPFAQKIQGVVQSDGTNVPFAAVGLIQVGAGPIGFKGIVGGTADATGNYSLSAPPDSYWVVAFQAGYVTDFKAAPHVTLAAGATLSTNLVLIGATTTLAGRFVDSLNPALPALPLGQFTVFNDDLLFTIAAANADANFNVPVTAGSWTIRASWQSAIAQGYLVPQANFFAETHYDTSAGPVTDAVVALKRATALIYGSVRDNLGAPVPGIVISANADGGRFDGFAISGADGLYGLGIDAGGGFVNVQDLTAAPANGYLWTGSNFGISDGQSQSLEIVGTIPTAHYRGRILDDAGTPVTDLGMFATRNQGGGTSLSTTDTSGHFDLPVFGGTWHLNFNGESRPELLFPSYNFSVTDGISTINVIIARRTTGHIAGYVHKPGGGGIGGLSVKVTGTSEGNDYVQTTYTDTSGAFQFAVFNATWMVTADPNVLQYQLGYLPPDPILVTLPPSEGVAHFDLTAIPPPEVLTKSLPDAIVGSFYFLTLEATNGVEPVRWTIAAGVLPDGLILNSSGGLAGTPVSAGLSTFTVSANDTRGSSGVRELSIRVLSAGVAQPPALDQPTLLSGGTFCVRVTGTGGTSYTLQYTTGTTGWTDIVTTNAPATVFLLKDPNARDPYRHYRLRVNPQ